MRGCKNFQKDKKKDSFTTKKATENTETKKEKEEWRKNREN